MIAHEVGHHVQNLLGILPKAEQLQRDASEAQANQIQVRIELQADCFAGLWDRAETTDGTIESFTIITCEAGPDCVPYHNRQPVVLERDQWARWLDLTADPQKLLRAGAAGEIAVERALEPAPPA